LHVLDKIHKPYKKDLSLCVRTLPSKDGGLLSLPEEASIREVLVKLCWTQQPAKGRGDEGWGQQAIPSMLWSG